MLQGHSQLPFPLLLKGLYPNPFSLKRSTTWRRGNWLCKCPPLTSSEVENLKRELKPLLDDPFGVTDQIDQFLGPQVYTWADLMSILSTLFSGKERTTIRRAAIIVWEREHPVKISLQQNKNFWPKTHNGIITMQHTEKT